MTVKTSCELLVCCLRKTLVKGVPQMKKISEARKHASMWHPKQTLNRVVEVFAELKEPKQCCRSNVLNELWKALHKQGRRLHDLLVNFGKVQCSQQIIISGWRTTLEKWEFKSPEEVPLQLWRRYQEMLDSCRFCPLCQERYQVIRIRVGRRLLLENDRQNRTNRTTLCLLT